MEKTIKRNIILFGLFLILILIVSACADVTNIDACRVDKPYGFFGGLWHGMIATFSFIGSLFNDKIAVYAVNNTGGWYDFGFLLGIGGLFVGAAKLN